MPNPTARPIVHGVDVDVQSRCAHWHSPVDVVAIRMPCCDRYWACIDCHNSLADHPPKRWPIDDDSPAVLCGACGSSFTVATYLNARDQCPKCGHGWNPGCKLHRHLYFDAAPASADQ